MYIFAAFIIKFILQDTETIRRKVDPEQSQRLANPFNSKYQFLIYLWHTSEILKIQ